MDLFKIKKLNIFEFIFLVIVFLFALAWIVQENPEMQKKIFNILKKDLERSWSVDINVKDYRINFFTGQIYIKTGIVSSKLDSNNKFSWSFGNLFIKFSRLNLIFKKIFLLDLAFENINTKSELKDNIPVIKEHFENILLNNSDINVQINSLNIKNIIFEVIDVNYPIIFNFPCSISLKYFANKYWAGYLNLNNGAIFYKKNILIKKLKTDFVFSDLCTNGIFEFNGFDTIQKYRVCFDKNILNISSENLDLNISFLSENINIFGNSNVENLANIAKIFDLNVDNNFLTGNLKFNLIYDLKTINGKFELFDFILPSGKTNFVGDILFDLAKNKLSMNIGESIFNVNLDLNFYPEIFLEKILFYKNNKKFIDAQVKNNVDKILYGNIDFLALKKLLPVNFQKLILGRFNSLHFSIDQTKFENISGKIIFSDGKILFKDTYNPIENLNFDFLIKNNFKELILSDFNIKFFKGNIYSNLGYINFDEKFYIKDLNIPFNFNNFLFNINRYFYSLFDANLILTGNNNKNFCITGDINFIKSYLNSSLINIESQNKNINNMDYLENKNLINFDLNLLTKTPLQVKGGLFDLNIDANLNMKTCLQKDGFVNYLFAGNLNIKDGSLNFLDKKLNIDYGKIQFLPNNLNDPIIDLVAKNKIGKYWINLQATGYLSNPKIILESLPKLDKKQVLGLLLSGSNDMNLQSQFSFLLQKNLSSIIANNESDNFLKKILNPFRYIQITPNFINNSGKSGFNGCLDVDLSDQLHAKIQKDFNLKDDLSVQLDYFLTDDINLRLLKDQRDEIGAEVEVRVAL